MKGGFTISAGLGSIYAELDLKLNNFDANINKAINGFDKLEQSGQKAGKGTETSFDSMNKKMISVGNDLSKFGGKMTKGVTLPLVGAGVASLKMAGDMETGVAKVSTVADMSKISIGEISSSIVDMSNKTGISTKELNESLYQTISAGIDTGNAVKFLDDANKLAVGGFTSTNKAVDLLSTTINAYGLEATDATRLSDLFIQSQNLGKLTCDELASAMGDYFAPCCSNVA